jgi:hypothetical protein
VTRRLLLALACAIGLAGPASAQWTHVQEDDDLGGLWNTDGIHSAAGLASQCTAGNLVAIITIMQPSTQTIASIDDASTTVYARLGSVQTDATRNTAFEVWWGICAGTGGGQNLTVTANAATAHSQSKFDIWEASSVSGVDTDQAGAQVTSTGCATSTTCTTSALTPTTTHAFFVAGALGGTTTGAYVVDADFTQSSADTRRASGYRIEGAGAAHGFTLTSGGAGPDAEDTSVILGVFEAAAGGGGGGGGAPKNCPMLGVC